MPPPTAVAASETSLPATLSTVTSNAPLLQPSSNNKASTPAGGSCSTKTVTTTTTNSTATSTTTSTSGSTSPPTPWLLQSKQQVAVSSDAVRLLCLAAAGSGAWVYQSWSERLAPHIQVLPIELPGHGARLREPRATNLCQLSVQVVDALTPVLFEGRYALFGHSMGAWLSWEILCEVTRRGLPLPAKLFVSGNRAPSLCGVQHDLDPVALHQLPPEQFWHHFELRYGLIQQLADPAMRAYMYPLFKDDFTMVETYQPSTPGAQTVVPIVAIGGRQDTRINEQQVAAWAQHTTGGFTELWLHNVGHRYIADAPSSVLSVLRSQLAPPPRQPQQRHTLHIEKAAAASAANGAAATDGATQRPPRGSLWRRCCCCGS